MKFGRLILTFREDMIPRLKEYYLDSGRTDFLVVAYNSHTVDPSKFQEGSKFKMVPYFRSGYQLESKHVSGQQFRVWYNVAKEFPEIEGWVIHDYDLVCKPKDVEIFSTLSENEYASIGNPIPVWQEGMIESEIDTYPFEQKQMNWHKATDAISKSADGIIDSVLMEAYPFYHQGIKTLLGGFGDFIATSSKNILLLDDHKIKNILIGGTEQVPHTIFNAYHISPVDMRKHFSTKILMDYTYLDLSQPYDLINPVKYWPKGNKPSSVVRFKNLLKRIKNSFKGNRGILK